jgi:hypothetical protein
MMRTTRGVDYRGYRVSSASQMWIVGLGSATRYQRAASKLKWTLSLISPQKCLLLFFIDRCLYLVLLS